MDIKNSPDLATLACHSTHDSLDPSAVELGHLDELFAVGDYAELENSALKLIKRFPNTGVAWKLLGIAQQMQNKDSLRSFQKVTELLPLDPEAHINLSAALRANGLFNDAINSSRTALQINANFAEAHNNLGVALQDYGALADAISSYRAAIEIKQNFAEAHSNLGSALKEQGDFDGAITSYRRALELKPDYAKVHSNLGIVQQYLGQLENAAASYQTALKFDPLCHEAMLGISQLCMDSGEIDSAKNLLESILKIKPDSLDARFLMSQITKATSDDGNMLSLIAINNSTTTHALPTKPTIQMHFALGKCYEDCGNYLQAFQHFNAGCALKRSTFKHDTSLTTQHFNDIIEIVTQEKIAALGEYRNTSQLPIFVLGMPRSGTTLTEQIISSHPSVYGAGELPDFLNIIQSSTNTHSKPYPYNTLELSTTDINTWANNYISALQQRAPEAQFITDKMPGNFLAIGIIHAILPNAKIIHVNRNPIDTCLSCFTQLFTTGQYQTYDLAELGQYYVDYARLMNHWRQVLPAGTILDVHYEDIVADQEQQAKRIISFCNLDWDDACINFYDNTRSVQTASLAQVRQPIYNTSIERWRHYESFLTPLLNTLNSIR